MFAAIAEFAHGWSPLGRVQNLKDHVAEMREAVAAAGRDPDEIEVSIFQARPKPEKIEEWVAAGVELLIMDVPSAPADEVLPVLDSYAPLIRDLA